MKSELERFKDAAYKLLPKAYKNVHTRIIAAKRTRLVAANTYLRPLIMDKENMEWIILTYKRARHIPERKICD